MTLAESMRQHDGRWARLGVTVVVSLLLLFGLALFARWIKPGELIQGRSVVRACFDAQDLYDARLLREARSAYIAVEKTYGRHRCPPLDRSIEADQMLAAAEREKGAEYLRAAQLRRGARFEHGRRIAQVLARQAFTASLAIDPYQARTRRDLNLLLDELPGPTDRASADLRCLLGSRLRAAGLLPEAVTVYTQALRVARHSKCTAHGLRLTRTDLAQGRQSFVEADALSADGRHDGARHKYLQALAIDSAISEARKALAANPGPDPEDGTLTGRARSTFDAGVAGLGGFVDWLAAHAAALGLAVVAACVALLVLMGFLMFLTRAKFVRGGLATWPLRWLPLRRFTHPRVRIAAFTPPEKAGGSEAIFAEYLMMAPILENADGNVPAENGQTPQDLIESSAVERDPLQDAATVIGDVPQAQLAAAALKSLLSSAPRWEATVSGQVLEPDARGHGLRVWITNRSGRTSGTFTVWASDLPGPQLPETPEAAVRYALAIRAAAWAHDAINR